MKAALRKPIAANDNPREKAGDLGFRASELKHILGAIADHNCIKDEDGGFGLALLNAAERLAGDLEAKAWQLSDELAPEPEAPGGST